MFDQIAPWYDFLNHALSLNVDRLWRRATTRLAPPDYTAPSPILDLCTGTGDLALAYDRAARGQVPIIGADFAPEMLQRAQRKAAARGAAERIRFIQADAQCLPFPDDTFQLVTVSFGLRNVTDLDRGLSEIVRVAQRGGRVAILEFTRPRHRIIGSIYTGYFRQVLPRIGQLLSRSPENAYRYLPESVLRFPEYEALAERMRSQGLVDVRFRPLTFGIATLYQGRKPVHSPDRAVES